MQIVFVNIFVSHVVYVLGECRGIVGFVVRHVIVAETIIHCFQSLVYCTMFTLVGSYRIILHYPVVNCYKPDSC